MESIRRTWHRIALCLVLAATGFLSFYSVGKEGYANTYYAAAVKSMLMSWHNFFFVSFDPGGYVSIDKPPVAFWLQAASAELFGFHGWSLILPQALAAVVSVMLLYHLVQRTFGRTAGLLAAAALAVTPVLAAVSRTNEVDSVLVMVVLFAGWALIVAAERGSWKLLLLSMALVGVGFNVKMAEAFMVLPAFYLVYGFCSPLRTGRKIAHLSAATALLLVISLSWATVVDLTPASQRPYVGSSQTNSVLELAIGYNGIQRVLPSGGPFGGHGLGPRGGRSELAAANGRNIDLEQAFATFATDLDLPGGIGHGATRGAGGFGGETGGPGVFRLLDQQMAGQISWLLPLALLGGLALFLRIRRKDQARRRPYWLALVFWGVWVLPMMAYFSIAGFFHTYYMVMLAPGLAALAGIGTVEMYRLFSEEKGWEAYILPLALAGNAALQVFMLSRYPQWSASLVPVAAVSGACALVLALLKARDRVSCTKAVTVLATMGFAALLAAPAVWATTPIMYGTNPSMPSAGPELAAQGRFGGGSGFPGGAVNTSQLTAFLLQNDQNEKYLVAVPNAMTAAPIILQTGKAVMAVGGFMGQDPIMTVPRLQQMVADGGVRYFLVQGSPGGRAGNIAGPGAIFGRLGGQSAVTAWVEAHGTLVPQQEWSGTSAAPNNAGRAFGGLQLYDLAAAS